MVLLSAKSVSLKKGRAICILQDLSVIQCTQIKILLSSFLATYKAVSYSVLLYNTFLNFLYFSFLLKESVTLTRVGPEVSCEGVPSSTGIATKRTFERLLSRV